jgi:hypothetical protein
VSDIVVEFGNGRFQPVVDRYLAGEHVTRDELARAWRDTTQISGIFDLPMYEAMLTTVRDVNASLPSARRLRVWLGDPPIDWSQVTSPADEDMNDWRDAFFARVVGDQKLGFTMVGAATKGADHGSGGMRFELHRTENPLSPLPG